jgi:hypothetical protein
VTDNLGHYEYGGDIGRGARSLVWAGWDSRLERFVAVKELVVPPGADPASIAEWEERFVRESRTTARLTHPGIVHVYDADTWDGRTAIVMEFVDGETLAQVLARGPIPAETALDYVDQLLDAIGDAHGHGIVHRDIKPENVFVMRGGRVKLSDFGAAYVARASRLTAVGQVVGTMGYMAPEQIAEGSVDERTDLFAIGVLAYEMLSGRNPFGASDGLNSMQIINKVVNEPVPELPRSIPGVGGSVRKAVARAMSQRPEERYGSAAEMRAALRRASGDTRPASWPPGVAAGTGESNERSAWASPTNLALLAVLAVAVVIVGWLFIGSGGGETGGQSAVKTPRSPSAKPAMIKVPPGRWVLLPTARVFDAPEGRVLLINDRRRLVTVLGRDPSRHWWFVRGLPQVNRGWIRSGTLDGPKKAATEETGGGTSGTTQSTSSGSSSGNVGGSDTGAAPTAPTPAFPTPVPTDPPTANPF